MSRLTKKKLLTMLMALFLTLGTVLQASMPAFAEETETDITDKVTIDSITSPNAEIRDSTNVNDFTTSLPWGADVDYKIDLTVNKGTAIQAGDIIEIPVKADYGTLYESYGLSVFDSEDGSLLGEATISQDKIRIKITRKNHTKTAAKLSIKTTLKAVRTEFAKALPTKAEVDAAYAAHPTGIDKVQILNKNVNVNVKSNYWISDSEQYYKNYSNPEIGNPATFFANRSAKAGMTSPTNISTHWRIEWNKPDYQYNVTSPLNGKTNQTISNASVIAAFLFGYDKAFGSYSATETSYLEDTLPSDTYKDIKISSATIVGVSLNEDGKSPLLRQKYSDGKPGNCDHRPEVWTLKFDELFTKKEAASGQSYEQFKASLKPGEYGVYKSANGDLRLVASLGKIGSKDPSSMYTWGDFCDKQGKETVIRRAFTTYKIAADHSINQVIPSQEVMEEIYQKIKDWPITGCTFEFDADLKKPVMRTGAYVENTATASNDSISGKNFFVVGDISLFTYKDGAAILKTDAQNGQGIEQAEFKLQEKDAAGVWVDTDAAYIRDHITIVGTNGGKMVGDRFYTSENGILNIRGLANGKTYRLVETKAPKGYDNSNPAVSKEFAVSFTDMNAAGDNKDLTLTNKKLEYKVTYKVVKNPNGEEIPAGSPAAPVDSRTYNLNATVDVKPDLKMTGYIFAGWHTESGQKVNVKDSDGSFVMPEGNVELVGYWIKNTTEVSGEKTWDDANNQDGKRPTEITVNLMSNGSKTQSQKVQADANGKWLYSFKNMPKYDAQGKEIKYTVTEESVPSYTTEINGFNIKNSYKTELRSINVTKIWIGKAANSAKIDLYADGSLKESAILSAATNWQHSFANLPKYKNGAEIKYTVKEEAMAGYDTAVSGDMASGYKVTNTNTEKRSISVTKKWVGKAADSAQVKLIADDTVKETATLTAADNWKHSFENLPRYDAQDGHEIAYRLEEVAVAGYTSGMTGTLENGFTITNTITGKVSVPVTKVWIGKAANSAKISLYADDVLKDSVTLNEANHWQHTFAGLDKYKDGAEIKYTVKEEAMDGYDTAITGDMANGYKVTNTNTEKLTIPVTKKWVGKAADSVTVKLMADNVLKETATLSAAGGWKHSFENLPKYDAQDGHEIVYRLEEVAIEGYTSGMSGTVEDGFTITNTITGKVSVPVTKIWIGKAADSAKISLYADGILKDSVTLNEANHWQHTFAGLDQYKDGTAINYTVKEEAMDGYDTVVSGDMASGYQVTNTNTEKLTIPVTKKWVGKPAVSATVKLLADNELKETATLTAAGGWKHSFENLPKYDAQDGHEIVYRLEEVAIEGYTSGMSGTVETGFTITNTITGKVSVPVTKVWIGKAAKSVKVSLYADGVLKDSVTLNEANHWQHTFAGLDQYKDGTEINYTIKEDPVDGYTSSISGDAENGFVISNKQIVAKVVDKPKTPKTGDVGNLAGYGFAIFLAAISTVLLAKRNKKA